MDHFSKNGYFFDSFLCVLHFQADNHYLRNNNLPEKRPYPTIFSFQENKQMKRLQILKVE